MQHGQRYGGELHVRVFGDQDAASIYLPHARKVMGNVLADAQHNGLAVHSMRVGLEDGTQILAEKIGDINRVTIVPRGVQQQGRARTVEGFFLTWAGSNVEETPVLFIAPGEDDGTDWRASFYDSESRGYAATPPDRRAATYMDVFGTGVGDIEKRRLERFLPGGGLWVDEKTEEAVTWFRGYLSYWPHHYRHPRTNYSNSVSIYGHVVYVAPFVGWRVLAAAKRDKWLYVMIAENLGVLTPPPVPPAPSYSGQIWVSQPYTDAAYTYSLHRYPLVVVTEPDTGVETYRAVREEGQALWRNTLELAYGAWSFNADCTACVTVQLPRIATWGDVWYLHPDGYWALSPEQQPSYPQVDARRLELTIEHDDDGGATASGWQALAPTLVAEEDGVQLTIAEEPDGRGGSYPVMRLEDLAVVMADGHYDPDVDDAWDETRILVHAHLPSRTLLFYRWYTRTEPDRYVSAEYELYVDGEQVEIEDPASIEDTFPAGLYDAAAGGNFFHDMTLKYEGSHGPHWVRPIDAMTFLLGFNFELDRGNGSIEGVSKAPEYGWQCSPHVPFMYNDNSLTAHASAGGYVYGSASGAPGTQFWNTHPSIAARYGANRGEYNDMAPSSSPIVPLLGQGCTYLDDTLVSVYFQPFPALQLSGPHDLMNTMRRIRFGSRGDAKTLLDALAGDEELYGFSLSHTGAPRKHQRGSFATQTPET